MAHDMASFECPRCESRLQIKRAGVRSRVFLCPVCLDGEIVSHFKPIEAGRLKTGKPARVRTPLPVA